MSYRAPEPTKEQIENGKRKKYDPYPLAGSLPYWDMAPDDALAAAAVIHDEMYTEGGSLELLKEVDANFERDCKILAEACDSAWRRAINLFKAHMFAGIVNLYGSKFWTTESRNTPVTREQGRLAMLGAKRWINECARKIGEKPPYAI